jgi:hypothetical protein
VADNQNVVDELVVKLTLDADEYKKADAEVDKRASETERKRKREDTARDRRERKRRDNARTERRESEDKSKDMRGLTGVAKQLGDTLKGVSRAGGVLFGLGVAGAGGILAAVTALTGFENGLRRTAVATGLSNKEMQAWQSTAQRLGADATSGGQSIADLAREQKQFALTGQAPTMQALQRIGVNVGPDQSIGDMLGQAQQVYRQSSKPQQDQIEAQLSAMGVSSDLIVMIKSETDAREAYNRSLAESTEENRKAMQDFNDAMAAVKNASIEVAGILASLVTPWAKGAADAVHDFAAKIEAAGGGVVGLTNVLRKEAPDLAAVLNGVGSGFKWLSQAADILLDDFHAIGTGIAGFLKWLGSLGGGAVGRFIGPIWQSITDQWNKEASEAAANNRKNFGGSVAGAVDSAGRAILGQGSTAQQNARFDASTRKSNAQEVFRAAVAQGATPAQALALSGQAFDESGFNPNATSQDGGAYGLFQWRGRRLAALRAFMAQHADLSPVDAQVAFAMQELRTNRRALRLGDTNQTAAQASRALTIGFETPALTQAALDAAAQKRLGDLSVAAGIIGPQTLAAAGAATPAGASGADGGSDSPGTQINLNGPITIKADNPTQLASGLSRVSVVQNFNSASR